MTMIGAAGGRAPRLDSLTSLRAVAALSVFGLHAAHWVPSAVRPLVTPGGSVGVTFFFVLSGVVLAWTMRPEDRARDFYRRRFARIAPSYWAAALVAVAVTAYLGGLDLGELARMSVSLGFLQAWFPDPGVYWAGNGVGWTLSVEALFYLLFPLIAPRLADLSTRSLRGVAAAAGLLALVLPAGLAKLAPEGLVVWSVSIFPPVRLPEFVLGVAVGILLRRSALPRVPLPAAAACAVIACLVATQGPTALVRTVVVVPLTLLLVAAAQSDLAGRTSPLRRRWAVLLGQWSFCFYLVHQLVIKVVTEAVPVEGTTVADHAARAALLVGSLGLATAAGAALHRFVEVPAEARLRPAVRQATGLPAALPVQRTDGGSRRSGGRQEGRPVSTP